MITRRAVLKTSAWSVPVVTLASKAPAFATSGESELCSFATGYQTKTKIAIDGGPKTRMRVDCYIKFDGCEPPTEVKIHDKDGWIVASSISKMHWVALDFTDSRVKRRVLVDGREFTVVFTHV